MNFLWINRINHATLFIDHRSRSTPQIFIVAHKNMCVHVIFRSHRVRSPPPPTSRRNESINLKEIVKNLCYRSHCFSFLISLSYLLRLGEKHTSHSPGWDHDNSAYRVWDWKSFRLNFLFQHDIFLKSSWHQIMKFSPITSEKSWSELQRMGKKTPTWRCYYF